MKRLLAMSVAVILLVGMLALPASSFAASSGVVQGGWLRLRAQPNFNAATINSYYTGTVVSILETLSGWYRVQTPDGNKGYMYSAYVNLSGGGGGGGVGTSTVWSANGYGVRMRSGPGTGYRVLAVYSVGTSVTVLQKGSYWSYIQIGSRTGYMMNQFLTDTSTPSPTPDANARIWSANGYGVRLRTGPGKGYGIIGVYSVGTTVQVLQRGPAGGWDRILVGSRTGYMMNEFLRYYSATDVTGVTLNTDSPVKGMEMKAASIVPYGATVSYQWIVKDKVVSTAPTYVPGDSDVGQYVRLVVTGTGSYTGSAGVTTKNVVTQPGGVVTGVTLNYDTPVKGAEMKAASITPGGATVDYQWFVDGTAVSTNPTYVVTTYDVGKSITLVVTGKGAFTGSVSVTSKHVAIDSGALNGVTLNTMSPVVGNTLSVASIDPVGALVSYQWAVDGVAKSTASTYTVAAGDAGKVVKLTVTGVSPYSGTLDVTTGAVSAVGVLNSAGIENTTNPAFTSPNVGDTLRATYDPILATVRYEWYVTDGTAANSVLVGNGSTYTVTATDLARYPSLGKVLLKVYGTGNYLATPDVAKEATTGLITNYPLLGSVVLSETSPKVTNPNQTITATVKLQNGTDVATGDVDYVWYADGIVLTGETSNTLTVTSALLGKALKAQAIAKGTTCAGNVTSAATSPVKGLLFGVNVALVSSPPKVGDVLTAELDPATATATYIWYAGADVSTMVQVGTGKTHTVSLYEYGLGYRYYKVKATGTGAYDGSVLESAPTSPAVPAPLMIMEKLSLEENIPLDANGLPVLFPEIVEEPQGGEEDLTDNGGLEGDLSTGTEDEMGLDDQADGNTPETLPLAPEGESQDMEPNVEEPAYEQPAYEEPLYEEPLYEEPIYQEPIYEEPLYEEPVYEEPVYEEPVYEEPANELPSQDEQPAPVAYEITLSKRHPKVGDKLKVEVEPLLSEETPVRYEWFVGGVKVKDAKLTDTYTVQEADAGLRILVKVWIGNSADPLTKHVDVEALAEEEVTE